MRVCRVSLLSLLFCALMALACATLSQRAGLVTCRIRLGPRQTADNAQTDVEADVDDDDDGDDVDWDVLEDS